MFILNFILFNIFALFFLAFNVYSCGFIVISYSISSVLYLLFDFFKFHSIDNIIRNWNNYFSIEDNNLFFVSFKMEPFMFDVDYIAKKYFKDSGPYHFSCRLNAYDYLDNNVKNRQYNGLIKIDFKNSKLYSNNDIVFFSESKKGFNGINNRFIDDMFLELSFYVFTDNKMLYLNHFVGSFDKFYIVENHD
jgi:hypothetical protein